LIRATTTSRSITARNYGLRLETILAVKDVLTEKLLPEFHLGIADLFAPTHC
jgi:hypothetical protein